MRSCTVSENDRAVPRSRISSGMTLSLEPPWIEVTLTTAASSGEHWRLTIVCSASTICAATTTMSMPRCGQAAWVPRPRMTLPKLSAEASAGPGSMANSPAGRFGRLCMPDTSAIRNLLKQPVAHHHAGASDVLLRRLEDEMHRPVEVARLGEIARRAEQHRGMAVVTAAVELVRHGGAMREV